MTRSRRRSSSETRRSRRSKVMTLLFALKTTGVAAAAATTELWAAGDYVIAAGAVPMLASMCYATRLYARRRARRSGVR